MLISSRPAGSNGDHIVLVALDAATAERIHDKVCAAYPKSNVVTRVGKAFGVVTAPTDQVGRIEGLIAFADTRPEAGPSNPPVQALLSPEDSVDAILMLLDLDGAEFTQARALLDDLDTDIIRAVIAASMGEA